LLCASYHIVRLIIIFVIHLLINM